MGRFIFLKGKQAQWLTKILKRFHLSLEEIAEICGVSARTVRDWKREKFTISENSCILLSKKFNEKLPAGTRLVENYWYAAKGARKGGLRSLELYGPPGTKEGRILGGLISQKRRRENPEKYRLLGCNVPKKFISPKHSNPLAEMMGIILGDGGVANGQLKITLDSESDKKYSEYVNQICKKLFGHRFSVYKRKTCRAIDLSLYGVGLTEILGRLGIKKGNKIKNQVDFPEWIWDRDGFQEKCVRGLMDTDGCVFLHYHTTKGIKYRNIGICFTSLSKPLLLSVSKILSKSKIKHSLYKETGRICIYSLGDVKRYFAQFGSSNPKHQDKFNYHLMYNRRLTKFAR